jgi:hypothetical protein
MQRAWTIHSIDEVNKAVRVNTGAAVINNYQVFIDDRSFGTGHPLATPAAAVNKVSNMADICGLNATNANTDRRVLERTEAWFMALEAVNRINNDLGGLPGGTTQAVMNLVYALWRDSVISMIKEKGFLTVWLKIFSAFPHPLAPRGPTFPNPLSGNEVGGAAAGALMNLGQDIATQIRNARYFPNTNFAQLP